MQCKTIFAPHLEDVANNSEVVGEVGSGRYNVVVLQGAMVSMSMSRTYSQAGGLKLAKLARLKKARVLLYVEWPRRGIDETEYTMNVYRGIARAADCEIVPVCYAWNAVLGKSPSPNLWQADGNRATPDGSFVAAACVYFHIAGVDRVPSWRPGGMDRRFCDLALGEARRVERKTLASGSRL